MIDIADFLLARVAEDERAATSEDHAYSSTSLLPTYDSEHQQRWNTDRVRAECEAKRQIVYRYRHVREHIPESAATSALSDVLRDLATSYAEHPEYQEAWRPTVWA